MDLSATAYVILGFLSWGPKSGYDIKAIVDHSTRFFWAASYGQIYPELRRLAEAGLIEASGAPEGGRRRTVYSLTAAGQTRLREWLASEPTTYELRDEGLLKLFFASADPASAEATLAGKRRRHLRALGELRAIEATEKPSGYALMVLGYGIEMHEWCAEWCERALAALPAEATTPGGS